MQTQNRAAASLQSNIVVTIRSQTAEKETAEAECCMQMHGMKCNAKEAGVK